MWPQTSLAKRLKLRYPLIQAPMAGATTPELVANVANAGGLGSYAAGYQNPETIRNALRKIRELTDKPFAVNLFISQACQASSTQISAMTHILGKLSPRQFKPADPNAWPDFAEQLQVILEEKIPFFSFTFGIPDEVSLTKLKQSKTVLFGTATTLAEALLLESQGIDIIVAQGYEAGGHRGSFLAPAEHSMLGTLALIPQIVDKVKLPVVAAGGIMDARGIVAALVLGASAVQMGTAFLSCPETSIHPLYREKLLTCSTDNTRLTRAFSGKLARGINTKFIEEMAEYESQILDYPLQNNLTRPLRELASQQGISDYMALWAGQAASLSKGISAATLIQTLAKDVRQLLHKLCKT